MSPVMAYSLEDEGVERVIDGDENGCRPSTVQVCGGLLSPPMRVCHKGVPFAAS